MNKFIKNLLPGTPTAEPETGNTDKEALETTWKIHAALVDWTGKVDAKAAFAVALESAGITTIVALSAEGRLFGTLQGCLQQFTYYLAIAALVVAAGCAMWVVMPRLRMRHVGKEWPENFIYFGHLRCWEPSALREKIKATDLLPVLTKQLVGMSRIAWTKHLLVKLSLICASVGGASMLACALLVRAAVQ
ncbi:Pycsar system effector family protein [Paenarthrobacter nitroguajacolicus]|uniref:Pycsar system effector family protein n=1 Tax=Paenarthrobacter nitroguajacolicus TaxID=211146 RepID=UPI001C4C5213